MFGDQENRTPARAQAAHTPVISTLGRQTVLSARHGQMAFGVWGETGVVRRDPGSERYLGDYNMMKIE